MQAQFYPPERPSNSSRPSNRLSDRRGPSLPPRTEENHNRVSSDVRAAASGGDFRAIATVLNHVLTPHDISAWVGEAGPGYLQITLTVKRPPTRKPLIRLVSHQLYSLKSDVILGANLTVQVAQTNLILWNQLVRLPLPEIYKQPSKWDIWREQLKEWQAQAGPKVLATWMMSQRTINAWYEKGRTNLAQSFASEEANPSDLAPAVAPTINDSMDAKHPHYSSKVDSPQSVGVEIVPPESKDGDPASIDGASPVSPRFSSAVPPEILQQAQQHAQQVAQAQQRQHAQANLDDPNNSHRLDRQQWSAMAMVPGVVMVPPMSSAPANVSVPGAGNDLGVEVTADNAAEEMSALGGGGGSGFGSGFGSLRQKVVHQVMNPSPWTLGGAAIAAFLIGSTLVDSISTTADSQDNRPVPTEQALPNATVRPNNEQREDAQDPDLGTNGSSHTVPHSSDAAALDPSEPVAVIPSRPTHRPKTVEMHDQTLDVVPLMPTIANRSEVTLTFSGNAIVPLPPPAPEKPKGWRSLFSPPTAPPPSHPADIAMALLTHPVSQSTSDENPVVTSQALHQGGIDVVNIAGNNVAKSQEPSLRDTVNLLSQAAIRTVGAGLTEEKASRPQIFDVKGHRIAVLGYVDTHLYAADRDMAGNNPGSRRRLAADIEAIREQVDWVIVSYHWSDVDTAQPTEQQVRLAHLAVDQGADLVVGYHPRVIQGAEVYNGRAIAYSLGQMPATSSPTTDASSPAASGSLSELVSTVPAEASADNSPPDDHVLDSVPHQLPNSGIRTSPSNPDRSPDDLLNVESPNHTMAAMLKVVLSDRNMGVEFIPVQTRSGLSEFAQGRDGQAVVKLLKEASRAFDDPLSLNGMAHLPLSPNIREFSNSAEESFQPDSTDGFIDQAE